MADNTTLNTGSGGDVIGSDDIGGVKFQRIKLIFGPDGTNSGDVDVANALPVGGGIAHDGVDAGNPNKIGAVAIAHGTNPTAVAAADRTNLYASRAGILFVQNGHPNGKAAVYNTTGAQTDDPVIAAVAGGTKIVVTGYQISLDEATTVGVAVRMGFGTASVPALGASGADGTVDVIFYHPGLVPGGGAVATNLYLPGADGADLRVTCEAPTSGTLGIVVYYHTIES